MYSFKKLVSQNHYDFDEASIGFHLYATAGLLDFWHFPAALLIVSWLSSSLCATRRSLTESPYVSSSVLKHRRKREVRWGHEALAAGLCQHHGDGEHRRSSSSVVRFRRDRRRSSGGGVRRVLFS